MRCVRRHASYPVLLGLVAFLGPNAARGQEPPRAGWEHAVCSFERAMRTSDDPKQKRAIAKELRSAKARGFESVTAGDNGVVDAFLTTAHACWFSCPSEVQSTCEEKRQPAHQEALARGKAALAAGDARQAAYLLRVAVGISSTPEARDALGQALAQVHQGDPRALEPEELVAADPPPPISCREYLTDPEIGLLISEPTAATNREADDKHAACLATWGASAQIGPPIPGSGPPLPPRGEAAQPWRRTFHESYSTIAIASIDVDPELPGGVLLEGNDAALALMVRGGTVWRPRDWKVLPWMEAGVDFGTTQFSSDPPEGEESILFARIEGVFGLDLRIVPWNDHKLNLAAGPLIGGHLDAFTQSDSAAYGWDLGGRVRGLSEKKPGKAPVVLGELRVYRRSDKETTGTYGEVQAGVGIRSVVLFGFYRARLSSTTVDDPEVQLADRMPFASFLGAGVRLYSDRD